VDRLINEPTAAALAYGIHKLADSSKFLVFDLGGGTFDVSVLEIFEGIVEVRASTGDNFLGGEDFNDLLVDRMIREHHEGLRAGKDSPLLYQRLRAAAERARRVLSTGSRATMEVPWRSRSYTLTIDETEFERLAEPLVARLRDPVLRALQDGAIRADELEEIVLVGGATRMPIVRRAVTRMFGRFPSATVNPDEAVALGAAVQAGLRSRDAALEEVVLTDVCPYSLGVETAARLGDGTVKSGLFTPVIERNTIVPASRARVFSTMQDGQREIEINIFQGEARAVRDNIALGSLRIPVPPRAAGEVAVECRFTYDVDGLLEVDLHVPETGERRQLVLVDDDAVPDRAALERRRKELAALKVHPRDRDENRAALARAERCYEMQLGDKRELVSRVITSFEAVLERQDPREVEQARTQLLAALDGIEGESFL
jgi:molecular chaperone HscC